MAYIDRKYILTFISEDDMSALTEANDENLDNAISRADDMINSYISNQVTLPLTEVPPILKGISYDLCIFYLHSRTQANNVPEMVLEKYEKSIELLKDISRGRAKLNFTQEPKPEQVTGIVISGDDLVMSRGMF